MPAITNLSATQNWTGNPVGGTTGTTLSWDATANTVEVWRAGFGHYPEYNDEGGGVPSASPTYPPGAGWVKTTVTAPGGTDYVTTRDFYYYVAYAAGQLRHLVAGLDHDRRARSTTTWAT